MARYNGLIIPRSYNDYFSRSDPQAIRDIVALAADGELNAESKNPLQNQAIAKIVPTTASPENKLIVQSQISGLTADVENIKNIIPNTASETNELADKNFVNSTVGTNTANYIYKTESGGEKVPFSSVAELEAYAGTVTNNDYAFVSGIDENGNAYYDRYKSDVHDGVVTWAKEYRLNNSSFTAEQWAAIQSGITAEKVAQFEGAVSPVDVVQSGNMSAVTSNAVNSALTHLMTKEERRFSSVTEKLEFPISNGHFHIFYSSLYSGRGLFLFVLPKYNALQIINDYNDGFVVEDKTSGANMKIEISLASWNTNIQAIVHIIL